MVPVTIPPRRSVGEPREIRSPVSGRSVRIPNATLLAPMDGVTDSSFRGLILDLGSVGGACSEFVRLTTGPLGVAVLRRELGPRRGTAPVALQLMSPGPEYVAETASRAEAAGADWVDLNFGCPVPRVFDKCAGSALLDHPDRLSSIVRAAADGTALPVSAKIRAGVQNDSRLPEVLAAAAEGGAALITLHARLRRDSYADPAPWERIARAAEFLKMRHPGVLLAGNGGVECAEDVDRMLHDTGCDLVMVGRAALRNPFVFRVALGGAPETRSEAIDFALRYARAVRAGGGSRGTGRLKMLVRHYEAGGLFVGLEGERERLLREVDGEGIEAWFRGRADVGMAVEGAAPSCPSDPADSGPSMGRPTRLGLAMDSDSKDREDFA